MIDEAETLLRETLDLRELRVRLEAGNLARIEVPLDELPRLTQPDVRKAMTRRFRELGFRAVTLDLEGFRSGSLNTLLTIETQPTRSDSSLTRRGENVAT